MLINGKEFKRLETLEQYDGLQLLSLFGSDDKTWEREYAVVMWHNVNWFERLAHDMFVAAIVPLERVRQYMHEECSLLALLRSARDGYHEVSENGEYTTKGGKFEKYFEGIKCTTMHHRSLEP